MQLDFIFKSPPLLIIFLIWSLAWKGYALWTATRKEQVSWFSLILILNTMGLLEILYVLYFQKYDFGSKQILHRLHSLPFIKKLNPKNPSPKR